MLIPDGKGHKLTIGVRCGDCLHFKKGPKFYEELCVDLGFGSQHKPCPAFAPNHYKLVRLEPDILKQLNRITGKLTASTVRILAYTFKNINILKSVNLQFGQHVYFCFGEDYLSHYFKGYVVGISHDKQNVLVSSRLREAKTSITLSLLFDSVFTKERFITKRKELVKKNKLMLPKELKIGANRRKMPIVEYLNRDGTLKAEYHKGEKDLNYDPPMLNTAPKNWLYPNLPGDKVKKSKGKKKLSKNISVIKKGNVTIVRLNVKKKKQPSVRA